MIIIPTYNEEEVIEKTIRQLESLGVDGSSYEFMILIFDSHSTDTTVSIVKRLQAEFSNLCLVEEAVKSGLGSAYLQAMKKACEWGAEIIFEFDADGSHQPKYILPMLKAIENGADVALGSRYIAGGGYDVDWSWIRRFLSRGGNVLARIFLSRCYKDFTSGFRATRAEWLPALLKRPFISKGYAYKIQLLWELHNAGAKIVEVPIFFIDREQGASKFSGGVILDSLKVVLLLCLRKYGK